MEIAKEKLLRSLPDQLASLKAAAKQINYVALVGGQEKMDRIEEIRSMRPDERTPEDTSELWDLDPTMPFRKRMAIAIENLNKELKESNPTENDDDSDLLAKVSKLAAMPDGTSGKIPALTFLKALTERAQFIEDQLGKDFKTYEDLLRNRPELAAWQPRPGNVFYRATTIPEKIAEQLMLGVIQSADITAEDLKQATVIGPQRSPMILPVEMVRQLEASEKGKPSGALAELSRDALGAWKVWTLLNPKRMLAYSVRNLTGDIDPLIAGAPGALAHTSRAIGELQDYFGTTRLQMSPDLRKARDLGVIGSSLTASEIPDIKDLPVFRRFYAAKADPTKIPKSYFATVKRYNEFRESVLRYAAFLYYRDQLSNDTLTNYGGSKREVVQALVRDLGVDAAAANLARNLMGDYGNLTVTGDVLRKQLIPFWSFQEVNLKRYPRMAINALTAGKPLTAATALTAGVGRAVLASRLAWMYAGLWAWNNLIYPALTGDDEEKDLPQYERANPHINLGRNPDGTTRVFRNVGALGDFMEWFGLNSLPQLMTEYDAGQIGLDDVAKQMALDPLNKVVGGARPEFKTAEELLTGTSRFPDATQPRSMPREEAIPNALGLTDEYKWAKGLLLGTGDRPRPHYWQRIMLGVNDPRQTALSQMHDLRNKFLQKQGEPASGSTFADSPTKTMRTAAADEDFEAFQQARKAFVAKGGSFKSFNDSIQKIDPVSHRLSDAKEKEFEQKFLTGPQRAKLQVSRDFALTLQARMLQWWKVDDAASVEKEIGRNVIQATDKTQKNSERESRQLLDKLGVSKQERLSALDAEFLRAYQADVKKKHPLRTSVPQTFPKTDAYRKRKRAIEAM